MNFASRPISSSASRSAAASGLSSAGSILPPGNAICPEWLFSSGVRCVSSTIGSARATTGTSTAAGLVAFTPAFSQSSGSRSRSPRMRTSASRSVSARRHLAGEPRAGALEELMRRRLHLVERTPRAFLRLHQANSLKLSAGAIAKNSPPETTPNISLARDVSLLAELDQIEEQRSASPWPTGRGGHADRA